MSGLKDATPSSHRHKIKWTGSLSELVELAYSLHTSGRINAGQININDIIQALERLFDIKISYKYDLFLAIRRRKKERAVFMKQLYECLNERILELDR